MVGDGVATDDITIPLVFLFSREGAELTSALHQHGNVDVLLLPKERQLGRGTQTDTDIYTYPKLISHSAAQVMPT